MTVLVLITFLFVAVIGKLVYLQIINSKNLQVKAIDQWTRDIPIVGERGDIYDCNGNILVDTTTTYTVYVRPVSVKNKYNTALVLSKVLGVNQEKLYTKMMSKVSEITVAKKVNKNQMTDIKNSESISGVYFSPNISRYYPYGDFMTQILGFTNVDGEGQSGVEAYYNNYLKGINGYILTETDLVGRELESNSTQYIQGKKGNNVFLTLDYTIQSFVEEAVSKAFIKHNAKNASCIVMNPKTGEILAMAQRPSYDLNNIPRDNVVELFGNSKSIIVSNVYEPGSTFKIITASLGLDKGVIDRDYNFFCPGYRIVDGQRIKCWKTKGHGSQDFDEGVQNSCNCLFVDIALRLGSEKFYNGINDFGLNVKTGIDISGEASGLTIPYNQVKSVDIARMGFGQAIAVTPIELICASSAAINGGKLMTPYILDKVENNEKVVFQNYPITRNQVIKESTSADMREILEKVVSNGSGRNAGVNGYRIGGKTGTAQKYKDGIIARGRYLSTFLGFAPVDDPEYIVLMMVDEPEGLYYGSIVAAPYVGEIFSKIFEYKNIKPNNADQIEYFAMPDLLGLTINEANKILKDKDLYYELGGEGNIIKYQVPVGGSFINKNNVVFLEMG